MDRIDQLLQGKPADRLAIIDHDGAAVCYGALSAMVADVAGHLSAYGIRGGDRVILVAENAALYGVVVLALSRLDAWVTLVNARQTPVEIAAIVAHADARALIFTAHMSAAAAAHAADHHARKIASTNVGDIVISPLRSTTAEPVDPGPGQVAALMYTTGTTSAPKAVMLTHDNLIFNARGSASLNRPGAGDRVLAMLPMTHIYGFGSMLLPCLFGGAALRMLPRFDPDTAIACLRDGDTLLPAVPQMYAAMIARLLAEGARLDAPGLRHITTGGAPLDPDLKRRVEAVFGLPMNNGYGMTETSPTIAVTRATEPRADISVGRSLPGVEVAIDAPGPDGVGEILIRGRNIMKGYYRDPEATAKAIRKDGFFRSGDLGRIDADGALFVVGRLKELIIRSGFNVYPPEIEAMLTRHPEIAQAAVIGRPIPGNEEILAFVMRRPAKTGRTPPSPDMIRNWLQDRLAAYKIPQRILIVDAFPTAATGKILKHKLTAHFADQLAASDAALT